MFTLHAHERDLFRYSTSKFGGSPNLTRVSAMKEQNDANQVLQFSKNFGRITFATYIVLFVVSLLWVLTPDSESNPTLRMVAIVAMYVTGLPLAMTFIWYFVDRRRAKDTEPIGRVEPSPDDPIKVTPHED
jgi:hypothetical protein